MSQGFINTSTANGVVPTQGTWAPVVTFGVPGDLSVMYSVQTGTYYKIGNLVTITINLSFTPTYTTAAGVFYISGIPNTPIENTIGSFASIDALTFPTSATQLYAAFLPDSTIRVWGTGSGITQTGLEVGEVPTATAQSFIISGTYLTS
jgi:hypothetical protein